MMCVFERCMGIILAYVPMSHLIVNEATMSTCTVASPSASALHTVHPRSSRPYAHATQVQHTHNVAVVTTTQRSYSTPPPHPLCTPCPT